VRLRLRTVRAGDAPEVTALQVASWRDAYRGILDGPLEPAAAAHWQERLATPQRSLVVVLAMLGGEAAGFVAVLRRDGSARIDNLHVRPGLRGAGIGRALLGFAARRMVHRGCHAADMLVFARNTGAIRFCTALGAIVGPEQQGETFGQQVSQRRCAWSDLGALIAAVGSKAS
jgi:ribosomal protein S18 acetylase RimI-like enzyme